jgi:hypothetical protein
MPSDNRLDLRSAALSYLVRGWSVIPIQPRDKRPLLPWLEFQHRLASPPEVSEWYRRWPDANVAIVTGALSGLVVLDIDPHHGGDQSLKALEGGHGTLPSTLEASTGRGGRHIYFQYPGGTMPNRVGIEPGVDLRGDGGYVVAPPSLHPSGGRYAWKPGRRPDDVPLAAMPSWLLRRLEPGAGRFGHPLAYWRQLVRDGVDEGSRNNTIASLAGHMLWHGMDPAVVLDLLLCWNRVRCRPPLRDDEVTQVVESISRLHARSEAGQES